MIENFIKYYLIWNRNRNNQSREVMRSTEVKAKLMFVLEITTSLSASDSADPDAYTTETKWKYRLTAIKRWKLAQ